MNAASRIAAWWRSFQARSVLASLVAALCLWAGWAAWSLHDAQQLQSSDWDREIKVNAEIVMQAFPAELLVASKTRALRMDSEVEALTQIFEFNFQVIDLPARRVALHATTTPSTVLNASYQSGFSNNVVDGKPWRVYTLTDSEGRVQVQTGTNLPQRQAAARYAVREGLFGLLWLLLPLTLVLAGVAAWTAQPLRRLHRTVLAREPDDDAPLPMQGLPAETVPLVQAFNTLLLRAGATREAQRQFIGDAAHELRTPLAVLRVQAQVALRSTDAAQREAAMRRLLEGIDRSTRVAEQLLDLARVDNDRPDPSPTRAAAHPTVDLRAVVLDALDQHRGVAARREVGLTAGDIESPDDAGRWVVAGHADMVGIAVRNVVDNALRYTPGGGGVTLALRRLADGAELTVTDTGPGLDAEQRRQAMEPFVRLRTRSDEAGSGLGLSIVERIARREGFAFELREAPRPPGLQAAFRWSESLPRAPREPGRA